MHAYLYFPRNVMHIHVETSGRYAQTEVHACISILSQTHCARTYMLEQIYTLTVLYHYCFTYLNTHTCMHTCTFPDTLSICILMSSGCKYVYMYVFICICMCKVLRVCMIFSGLMHRCIHVTCYTYMYVYQSVQCCSGLVFKMETTLSSTP